MVFEFMPEFKTGSKTTYASHNFADKTSWWAGADKITGETLTDSGDGLTFNFTNTYLINAEKCTDRDHIKSYGWLDIINYNDTTGEFSFISIYIDGTKTSSGFTIDHENGTITFNSSQSGKTITSDYYKANSSIYTITPFSNKVMRLLAAEVQVSSGCTFNDVFRFTIKAGGSTVYQKHYNSARDYMDESSKGYSIPAFAELTKDIIVIPWDYPTTIDLRSSYAMTLELELMQDIPLDAEMASVTFYFVIEDE